MLIKDLKNRFRAAPADTISADKARKLISALSERKAEIERLQRLVTEHEARIEALQHDLRQAKFRAATLERSYATQLQSARVRAETAEKSAEEKEPRIKELELSHKLLQRKFDDAQARLDMIGPAPVSIDELLASCADGKREPRRGEAVAEVELPAPEDMLDPSVMFVRKDQ